MTNGDLPAFFVGCCCFLKWHTVTLLTSNQRVPFIEAVFGGFHTQWVVVVELTQPTKDILVQEEQQGLCTKLKTRTSASAPVASLRPPLEWSAGREAVSRVGPFCTKGCCPRREAVPVAVWAENKAWGTSEASYSEHQGAGFLVKLWQVSVGY